jgi:glycosyltransferase involved in cell wall biosynthesis
MTPYPSLAVVFAKLASTPIVAVQHEFYDRSCYETYGPVTATIQLAVQNLLRVFHYSAVIVPTSHVRTRLASYGVDERRITVVPNGIEWERYQISDVESRDKSLVTVGRLSKRKGQATVLRAFSSVHADHPEASLDVLGDGPAWERLERLADELDLGDAVSFHGYVSEDEKIERLNRSSLFVFGSNQEGFGLVLLEAMAAGLPVVARRLPVYEDFFTDEENGFLVDEPLVSNLATAMSDFLEDGSKRETIGARNRNAVATYDWERTADETEKVLESSQTRETC